MTRVIHLQTYFYEPLKALVESITTIISTFKVIEVSLLSIPISARVN